MVEAFKEFEYGVGSSVACTPLALLAQEGLDGPNMMTAHDVASHQLAVGRGHRARVAPQAIVREQPDVLHVLLLDREPFHRERQLNHHR